MKRKPIFFWTAICLLLFFPLLAYINLNVQAAPFLQPTPFPTPTPGPDGRILYTVQEGDTLNRISAISGITVDEIRALNNLSGDIIAPGQVLLLGLAGPAQPTEAPGVTLPTNTPAPTPTVGVSTGMMCILLFEDVNGDALRQTEEMPIAGGAISISSREGEVSLTADTTGTLDADGEPLPECFDDLPSGDYNITIAAPEGYNPTTLMNYALTLGGGDETYLDFGAQANAETITESNADGAAGGGILGPVVGIFGIILVAAGIGLAIYASRLRS
jgi:murein DD-endopeptidase MepM/ murein hydrolase activator NlpD